MSGDETDGDEKTHPPTWRIIPSRWQADALRSLLWKIDGMGLQDWAEPKGTRATQGNPPRLRVLRDGGEEEDGVAAIGLWRNCYNPEWLKALLPHQVANLQIIDADYDFSLE